VPDYGHPNSLKAQDPNSFFGKILLLNSSGDAKIFSMGHRNPQGLFFDKDNDIVISSEHGPVGGDEINIIKKNKNYGWPISSYGLGQENTKYTEHKKHGFEEPIYYFESNCGPSDIIKIPENFLGQFKNDYLLGCLSGRDELYGSAFYHYRLNKNKLKKVDRIFMNDRIRDLRMFEDNILVFILEKQHSLGFIYK
jgi:glucose/arabinose dehydrogenase